MTFSIVQTKPVGEGVKATGDLEAIEGRGEINVKVISVVLLLGHKVATSKK